MTLAGLTAPARVSAGAGDRSGRVGDRMTTERNHSGGDMGVAIFIMLLSVFGPIILVHVVARL
jgi:hypothetical protein